MSSEWNPAADPNSHLSRYLAFFKQPGINPEAIREEVVKKFENPDMNLREADELLDLETTVRLFKAHDAICRKLDRNSLHGALATPTPPGLYTGDFYRSHDGTLHRSKPMVLPTGMPNVNKVFGSMGLGRQDFSSLHVPRPHQADMLSFIQEGLELRRKIKLPHVSVGTIGHVTEPQPSVLTTAVRRVLGHDPATGEFALITFTDEVPNESR